MGRHRKQDPTPRPKETDATPVTSGRGWLSPDDRENAEKLIAETNRRMVEDAARDIAIRRYHHDGRGTT